jgi:hypothetical protein
LCGAAAIHALHGAGCESRAKESLSDRRVIAADGSLSAKALE